MITINSYDTFIRMNYDSESTASTSINDTNFSAIYVYETNISSSVNKLKPVQSFSPGWCSAKDRIPSLPENIYKENFSRKKRTNIKILCPCDHFIFIL